MTIAEETIARLEALDSKDREGMHVWADDLLLDYVDSINSEVAKAYREARSRIGFWYA